MASEPQPMEQSREATEVAQALAQLVAGRKALPDQVAEELHRLVGHDLAHQASAQLRWGHMRLLTHLIRTEVVEGPSQRRFITRARYDQERLVRRELQGEQWPSSGALCDQYGHWLKCCTAAANFWMLGGRARVAHNWQHSHFRQSYHPQQVTRALIQCREDLGRWPTEWEYETWAVVVRRTAQTDPQLPVPKVVRKAFGSFDEALNAAKDVWGEGQQAA